MTFHVGLLPIVPIAIAVTGLVIGILASRKLRTADEATGAFWFFTMIGIVLGFISIIPIIGYRENQQSQAIVKELPLEWQILVENAGDMNTINAFVAMREFKKSKPEPITIQQYNDIARLLRNYGKKTLIEEVSPYVRARGTEQ